MAGENARIAAGMYPPGVLGASLMSRSEQGDLYGADDERVAAAIAGKPPPVAAHCQPLNEQSRLGGASIGAGSLSSVSIIAGLGRRCSTRQAR
jgi:hypothetical protein